MMTSQLSSLATILCTIIYTADLVVPLFPKHLVRDLYCRDDYSICRYRSRHGGCAKNSGWMKWYCRRSCNMCHLKYECKSGLRVELPTECPQRMFDMSDNEIQQKILKIVEVGRIYDKFRYPNMTNDTFPLSAPQPNSIQIRSNMPGIQLRMYDGNEAAENTFKYHVQLIDYQAGNICGGAAIGDHFVLTVAHCVVNYTNGLSNGKGVIMKVGSVKYDQGSELRLTKIAVHEEYTGMNDRSTKREHDIALIFTRDQIDSDYIIELADRKEKVNERVQLSGLGYHRIASNGRPYSPDSLQIGVYEVLDEEPGDSEHTFVTTGDVANGDSGGPLTWKDKRGQNVLGGVHRGTFNLNAYNRLPPNYVAEYIRVFDFIEWIKDKQTELMSEEVFDEELGSINQI